MCRAKSYPMVFVLFVSPVFGADILVDPPFDPGGPPPQIPPELQADETVDLYFVQFTDRSRAAWRDSVESAGGMIYGFVPKHAHVVEMDTSTRDDVEALSFVEWVGPFHPYYRLPESLRNDLSSTEVARYNILVTEPAHKQVVADRLELAGFTVDSDDACKRQVID